MTKVKHSKKWVMVWGSTPPVHSVGYDAPLSTTDSGFTVLFEDAPEPEDVPEDNPGEHPGISVWCLHCLIEEHPEIGRGLDIAREHGVADLGEGGEWVVGDLRRLEADEE